MKRFLLILCGLVASGVSTAQSPLAVEKGVSLGLAQYRKSVVGDLRYHLYFHLPEKRTAPVSGSAELRFQLRENGQDLQLDFRGERGQIDSVVVNGKPVPVDLRQEHLIIPKEALRTTPNSVRIHLRFGDLSLNRSEDYLYTLLVPDRMRTVFPCFDQPDLKAMFSVAGTAPKGWAVLTNSRLQVSDSADRRHFRTPEAKDQFSTYLFSLVAGKFQKLTRAVNGRPSSFYHRETDTAKLAASIDSIFYLHDRAVKFLEAYTGIRFPFRKLDFAAIPDFQYGGMEHVGAIDYKASTLFLDRKATKDQRQARASLIAHEVAHMWFGDLVTMRWFNDVWMKEVFANFMADKITEDPANRDAYRLKFIGHLPRAFSVDRTAGAHPIRQALPNLAEAGTLYGPIIYDKAPVMMQQLELLMGEKAFREGLREYLKTYSYGNADWNDLIRLLDQRTPEDLEKWNEAWVNGAGRPVIDALIEAREGKLVSILVKQRGEQPGAPILPQQFEIALVYEGKIERVPVKLSGDSVRITSVRGRPLPGFVLFNSSGSGYGLFPIDRAMTNTASLTPLMRASAYINLYEHMLAGSGDAGELMRRLMGELLVEGEPLNQSALIGYIGEIYWRYADDSTRRQAGPAFEEVLQRLVQAEQGSGKQKIVFRLYQNIAQSPSALDTLYRIWKQQSPPAGLSLNDDEYTALALQLAVKGHPDTTILAQQLARLTNPDRRARLQFLMPALSRDEAVRDSFFASLKDPVVRKRESWVADALSYLHHPTRASASVKYIRPSLELLEEIRRTGDIFFPSAWLQGTLGGHRSKEAADMVRRFLADRPDYNPQLKRKILQAADGLFRAEKQTGRSR